MRRRLRGLAGLARVLSLGALLLASGCAQGPGRASPEGAARDWAQALDRGRWDTLAALAPPGLSPAQQAELALDLQARLEGLRSKGGPPVLSGVAKERGAALQVARGEGAPVTLTLRVVEVDSRWYVAPPRDNETQAM